ncbi:MAG TPA: hypothetical protein VNQ76_16175 [Planctomicrobium sp.]|nr:hypothetical protein [Planctomicrobium sp.]
MMSLEFAVCSAVATLRAQGLPSSALELATLSLDDDSDQGRLWELKGLLHADQGEVELARKALETANSLVPLQPEGRCTLAECYTLEGMTDLARDLFCSLVEWDQTQTTLLLRIASSFDRIGRADLSVHACRKASLRDPGFARPFYEMAYYMRRCQYPPHLIESMARHAVQLDPDSISYRIGLAAFLHSLNRMQDAYQVISDMTLGQLRRVTCHCCLTRLVDVCEAGNDLERTQACHERLLEITSGIGDETDASHSDTEASLLWNNRLRLGQGE